jgi:microcystin-dependent protein
MEPILGQVQLFAFNFTPAGWALCNGQLLKIEANAALFSIIGGAYGGDGQTTFALPDLQKIAPPKMFYCIAITGTFPARS